jgi:hypothetical protein
MVKPHVRREYLAGKEWLLLEFRAFSGVEHDCQVELPSAQTLHLFECELVCDPDRHIRLAVAQSPDVLEEPLNRECRNASDPQRCAHPTRPATLLDRTLESGEHLAGLVGEDAAGVSQRNGAARPIEKANTQFVLELEDRMRERRLRELEPLRRPPEMQLLADSKEVAEMTEIDRGRNRRDKSLAAFRRTCIPTGL